MKLIVVNCKCYLVKSPNYFRATDLQKIRRYLLLKIKKKLDLYKYMSDLFGYE